MRKLRKYMALAGLMALTGILLTSCKEFLSPKQELNITEDMLFDDWYEYRSVAMGMYGLQQNLAEQLFILGELRADLVEGTDAATADMVEIENFSKVLVEIVGDPLIQTSAHIVFKVNVPE